VLGSAACGNCGSRLEVEGDAADRVDDISTGYVPYCRACGVPVAREAALHCTKCGVTPLCREHFYPSTRSCALCPPFELEGPGGQTADTPLARPSGPWARPRATVPCPKCGARIRQGVDYCPDCGHEQEGAEKDAEYAGFMVRAGAAIIDSLITGIPAAIIASVTDIPAFGTILSVVYYVLFTYLRGQTPGKMILNIHVVDAEGHKPDLKQVILREVIGKAISALALLMGYLWIIWDPKKRGWHDYIAGTFVVKRRRH